MIEKIVSFTSSPLSFLTKCLAYLVASISHVSKMVLGLKSKHDVIVDQIIVIFGNCGRPAA